MIRRSILLQFLFGLVLALPLSFGSPDAARAAADVWISGVGNDVNDGLGGCTRTAPCKTLDGALAALGGQNGTIRCIDPIVSVGSVTIGGGVTVDCTESFLIVEGTITIKDVNAGATLTLRGLSVQGGQVLIQHAAAVNIEKCAVRNAGAPGIQVALTDPNNNGFPPTVTVKIEDTVVTGSAGGLKVAAFPNVTVDLAISRSSFLSNSGGGIRIDGGGGGTVTASIRDSESSMNVGNGILAVSGPGNVAVNITRSVTALNVASGVQSNAASGGTSVVTVRASTLTNNAAGQVNSAGGATLGSFGDNNLVGPLGTGFTATGALF